MMDTSLIILGMTWWGISIYAAHRLTVWRAQKAFEKEAKAVTDGFSKEIQNLKNSSADFKTALAEIIIKDICNGDKSEIIRAVNRLISGGSRNWRAGIQGLKGLRERARERAGTEESRNATSTSTSTSTRNATSGGRSATSD